jgi:chromate transporter
MTGSGEPKPQTSGTAGEVAALFLKLGSIAFGGPAAHIALMRREVVARRGWVSDQQFLDLVGAASLIPGPSSTELAIFLGYVRAGWPGLVLAGGLFILPAMLIVLGLAWAYVRYGTTPAASAVLYGVKPVIIAVVADATWRMARTAVKSRLLACGGLLVGALSWLGVSPILLLFGVGLTMLLVAGSNGRRTSVAAGIVLAGLDAPAAAARSCFVAPALGALFLKFLKLGTVVYGSGYVLLAFLRDDLVLRLGWLTDRQLVDAVAVGQFTPGPVFTTATFIGYLLAGVPGALLATLGIFLPSFLLVALAYPLIARLRASALTSAFLDGVNVASLGLMAAVCGQLCRVTLTETFSVLLTLAAGVALAGWELSSVWLIVAGGALGLLRQLVAG